MNTPVPGRVVAIIQARVSSTRLPGKVLKEICGKPMLTRIVERTERSATVDEVIVATSTEPSDHPLAQLCDRLGVPCFRGSEDDVLQRYEGAAQEARADHVVRITGDCPFVDPDVVDLAVRAYREGGFDYASNVHPPTFPDGLDVEVFSRGALGRIAASATSKAEREHVTLYVTRHPDEFHIGNVRNDPDLSHRRWTVDEPADLEFARRVYDALGADFFSLRDVLALLEKTPEFSAINRGYQRNEGLTRSLREEGRSNSEDSE